MNTGLPGSRTRKLLLALLCGALLFGTTLTVAAQATPAAEATVDTAAESAAVGPAG